ncbi:hypothetical protein VTK73DRAFT_774 [Phialemonium thermophilum]|uniref:Uncharacterized protein n=1 Tax=Phialemonium thermophilum TaxID=223376 RepID=A0ABR3VUB3_9PEZI
MCIGAFDGVVRRVVKRGRPRKNRPDLDERRDKRERTRRKNRASTAAAAASESTSPSSSSSGHSGYEDSSAGNSPATAHELDGLLDDDDDQQFCDMMDVGGMDMPPATTVTMNPTDLSVSCAPMPTLEGGAAMSPAEVLTVISPEQIHSPGALSHYSHVSHASIGGPPPAEGDLRGGDLHDQPTLPGSPAKSVASHYTHQPGTPPELSASSSPPPTGTTSRFFDADPHSSGLSGSSLALGSVGASCGGGSMGSGAGGGGGGEGGGGGMGGMTLEEEMLLFANEGGLVQLDRDLMLGSKFDDEYDPVTMFTNSDDVFFGSA